jgi:hypothetical protein
MSFQPIGQAAAKVLDRITLQEWDQKVAPCLHAIHDNSKWIAKHAERVDHAAKLLPSKPSFETEAYAELALAEAELKAALASVQEAMTRYKNLEVAA